jgi:hypothetical protein
LLTIFCFSPHAKGQVDFGITWRTSLFTQAGVDFFKGDSTLASRSALDKRHADGYLTLALGNSNVFRSLKFERRRCPYEGFRSFHCYQLSAAGTSAAVYPAACSFWTVKGSAFRLKIGSSAAFLLVSIRPPLSRARPQAGHPCPRRLAMTFICRAPDRRSSLVRLALDDTASRST